MTSAPPNLTGKLLLAHPTLRDPNFRRSIVYLVRHDPLTGAFGFILNRPTSQTFEELDVTGVSPFFADTPLYLGGPVATDSVILVMLDWDPFQKKMKLLHSIKTAPGEEEFLTDPLHTIALIGYAGWGEGQLEEEIAANNSWLILDPDDTQGLLLQADAATWKTLVAQMHPKLKLLAEMPDDPGLN